MANREVTHNVFQTTLNANALAGDTSMTLTTVSGLSTTNPFRLRIDDDPTNFAGTYEIVLVGGVNGATSQITSLTRGVDGTSAIGHSTGAKVTAVATKAFWDAAYDPPYKSRAYQNAGQSIPNNTQTKVTLDTVSFDSNSNWDVTTNHQWTCPTTGYYLVTGMVQMQATTGFVQASVYKNGVQAAQGSHVALTASFNTNSQAQDILSLTTGDLIALYVQQTSGGSITTSASAQTVYLAIAWLGN